MGALMRVLHITAMNPLSPNSGIPAVLKQLADSQNKIEGVESYVLSLCGDVTSIGSPYFYYLQGESIGCFFDRYKPDVAILHSFFHVEYIKVVKQLRRLKIPFFVEPHGSFGKQALKKSQVKKTIANLTVFRPQIKKSKGYIFTNLAELRDSAYRTENDLIIPNGIDPEIVNNSNNKSVESFENPVLYFLGRFDIHHKGLDYLFDALDILEEKKYSIKIIIYGTGNNKQIEYVNNRIKKYNYICVKNGKTIYGQDKKDALEKCNILLLTSRYEGSPMTVLDGLSYGNPCIATPGTNIADELVENKIGWRAELSAESIAQTIINAIGEYTEDGVSFFSRCKEYVLRKYSWLKIGEYSINEYKKVL